MGNSKNLHVFNFAIQLKSRKFDARVLQYTSKLGQRLVMLYPNSWECPTPVLCPTWGPHAIFSERELAFTFAVCHRPSVCLSSVTFVHPTQAIEIFGDISTPFGTLATCWHPGKISLNWVNLCSNT